MQRRRIPPPQNVSDQEAHHLAEPSALATIILCGFLILYGIENIDAGSSGLVTLLLGLAGIFYAVILFYFIMPVPARLQRWKCGILAANTLSTCIGLVLLPKNLEIIPHSVLILIAAIMVIFLGRATAYFFLIVTTGVHILSIGWTPGSYLDTLISHLTLTLHSQPHPTPGDTEHICPPDFLFPRTRRTFQSDWRCHPQRD
jgi:hypothetical protein